MMQNKKQIINVAFSYNPALILNRESNYTILQSPYFTRCPDLYPYLNIKTIFFIPLPNQIIKIVHLHVYNVHFM